MRFGNPYTLGKYPGAVNLMDIASKWEDRAEAKRALHFVASFYEVARCLSGGHGMPRHKWLLHLAYRKFVNDIAVSRLTGKLRTHVGSVIHAIYADELGEFSLSTQRHLNKHGRNRKEAYVPTMPDLDYTGERKAVRQAISEIRPPIMRHSREQQCEYFAAVGVPTSLGN